jgi:hypothetical protein
MFCYLVRVSSFELVLKLDYVDHMTQANGIMDHLDLLHMN